MIPKIFRLEPATLISPLIVKHSASFEPLRPSPDILQPITTVHDASTAVDTRIKQRSENFHISGHSGGGTDMLLKARRFLLQLLRQFGYGQNATRNDGDRDLAWITEASAEPTTLISPVIVIYSASIEPPRPSPHTLQTNLLFLELRKTENGFSYRSDNRCLLRLACPLSMAPLLLDCTRIGETLLQMLQLSGDVELSPGRGNQEVLRQILEGQKDIARDIAGIKKNYEGPVRRFEKIDTSTSELKELTVNVDHSQKQLAC